jgi:putative ABC transport system ATP-binding protein
MEMRTEMNINNTETGQNTEAAPAKDALISIRSLVKQYTKKDPVVLKGITLDIRPGEFIAVMGRSGCGKTTFLKTVGLIETPTAGEIFFNGNPVSRLWSAEIADIRRRHIGFVYQNYNLMNSLSAVENIILPAVLDKADTKEKTEEAERMMEDLRISKLRDKYPGEMSGGEKQRVALCRALINDPEVILADEPTGNLDSVMGREVIETLSRFNYELGKTILLVTHDPKISMWCRSVIFMKDGLLMDRIERGESGSKEDFYREIQAKVDEL